MLLSRLDLCSFVVQYIRYQGTGDFPREVSVLGTCEVITSRNLMIACCKNSVEVTVG